MRILRLLILVLPCGPALADDVSRAERLLCSTLQATACGSDAACESLAPSEINIPQFVQVDLAGKRLSTTPASGEQRQTPLRTIHREQGQLVLQGYEQGRAFSLVIDEETGKASFASAGSARGVIVFAACTPLG